MNRPPLRRKVQDQLFDLAEQFAKDGQDPKNVMMETLAFSTMSLAAIYGNDHDVIRELVESSLATGQKIWMKQQQPFGMAIH